MIGLSPIRWFAESVVKSKLLPATQRSTILTMLTEMGDVRVTQYAGERAVALKAGASCSLLNPEKPMPVSCFYAATVEEAICLAYLAYLDAHMPC